MQQSKNGPWLVIARRKKHYFKNQTAVMDFIGARKGKITAILYKNKLIREESRIYHEAMLKAGLLYPAY
jgi:hypothetical protein